MKCFILNDCFSGNLMYLLIASHVYFDSTFSFRVCKDEMIWIGLVALYRKKL